MSADLQTLLRPLREVEPTGDELARVRAAIADERPATTFRHRFFGRRPLMVLAAASLAIAVAVAALPTGGKPDSLRGALQAAAAAAAEAPVAGAPFTGYRHIVDRVREAATGSKPREYRREVWIDAKWGGVERMDGRTTPLGDHDGPFGNAPLAKLPTDPDALLRALNAAYDDGSYAAQAAAWKQRPKPGANVRRAEMAMFTSWLIVESNATPKLRGALSVSSSGSAAPRTSAPCATARAAPVAGSSSPGAERCPRASAGSRPSGSSSTRRPARCSAPGSAGTSARTATRASTRT